MEGNCFLCGEYTNLENHHIIKRSASSGLKNCKYNLVGLCMKCHRTGENAIHGKNGKKKDTRLRAIYFSRMRRLIYKSTYRVEELKDVLGITLNEATRLLKTVHNVQGRYYRQDILRALMGGKMDIQGTELGGNENE